MPSKTILSRVFDRMSRTMYHGTHAGNYSSLFSGIKVSKSRSKLDFGKGFYLTSDFQQASKHATKKAANFGTAPVVFVYNIDLARLRAGFKGYILRKMDTVWAQFIYDNRSSKFSIQHSYDYVYGGVADGQNLFDLLDEMDNAKIRVGEIEADYFLDSIAKFLYDQLSIHNQNIVDEKIIELVKVVKAYEQRTEYLPA
jgi:hypothetical protein